MTAIPVTKKQRAIENLLVVPFVVAITGIAAMWVMVSDRAPPFEYVSTDISPRPAIQGGTITIARHVVWNRQCDGEVYTEIVGPNGIVNNYARAYRPFPYHLGEVMAESNRPLSRDMLAENQSSGTAFYRGRVRFHRCGLTSRIWPIEVDFQEVAFEVVRRQ